MQGLPYGTYLVVETTVPHDLFQAEPFLVSIDPAQDNNPWGAMATPKDSVMTGSDSYQKFTVLDEEIEVYLRITKIDEETGKPVLLPDTAFQIYWLDEQGHYRYDDKGNPKLVTMTDTINGHLTKDVSTFYTNAEGILTLPEKLPLGKYRIVEVSGPDGFYNEWADTAGYENGILADDADGSYYVDFEITTDRIYQATGDKNENGMDIQSFYQKQLERVKPNTVIHYHAIIHRALKYAVKTDLIDVNPADKVDRPKKNEFTGNFYSREEMNALFDAVRGNKIEIPVMLAAFYGLRRSEVVGLKWDAVDFEQNTLEIRHTVATVRLDGKKVIVESDTTKTKASKRTLPLVPVFRERLLALQEEQKENRKLCGRSYNKKYDGYICVDPMGNLLMPNALSDSFQLVLRDYNLRRIRFHDLRHSCASLLLANNVPMKQIQEWLGHSDFSTTANIYSHLDYSSKVSSAEAMLNGLGMGSNPQNGA